MRRCFCAKRVSLPTRPACCLAASFALQPGIPPRAGWAPPLLTGGSWGAHLMEAAQCTTMSTVGKCSSLASHRSWSTASNLEGWERVACDVGGCSWGTGRHTTKAGCKVELHWLPEQLNIGQQEQPASLPSQAHSAHPAPLTWRAAPRCCRTGRARCCRAGGRGAWPPGSWAPLPSWAG